jgi:hypothetical protein
MKLREWWICYFGGPLYPKSQIMVRSEEPDETAMKSLGLSEKVKVIEAAPALAALHAAEAALLDASYALSDGSPAKRQALEALALVRETLGVGPRWLDGKPK